jgi:hypothetical protein
MQLIAPSGKDTATDTLEKLIESCTVQSVVAFCAMNRQTRPDATAS